MQQNKGDVALSNIKDCPAAIRPPISRSCDISLPSLPILATRSQQVDDISCSIGTGWLDYSVLGAYGDEVIDSLIDV
jgi:hypothetical protein